MRHLNILYIVFLLSLFVACNEIDPPDVFHGVTFTRIISAEGEEFKLNGNIVNYDEIIGYDSKKCIFLLSEKAGKRIREENFPVSPTRFAIAVDGELIYIANFIPAYSSLSCVDCITVEPYSYDNKYRIRLGYPGPDYYSGHDPRNDARIISRLKNDHKLIDIND